MTDTPLLAAIDAELARLRSICHQRGERILRLEAELDAAHQAIRHYQSGAHHIGYVDGTDRWEWPDERTEPVTDAEQQAIAAARAGR
jgi:hypothetical protein